MKNQSLFKAHLFFCRTPWIYWLSIVLYVVPSLSHASNTALEEGVYFKEEKGVKQTLNKRQKRKIRRKQKRQARKQERLKRLSQKLREKKKCNCKSEKEARSNTDSFLKPKYDKETRRAVAGAFFAVLGLASLTWLFIMSAAGLWVLKLLALGILVVGDRLLCNSVSFCLLEVLLELLYIISDWWWLF